MAFTASLSECKVFVFGCVCHDSADDFNDCANCLQLIWAKTAKHRMQCRTRCYWSTDLSGPHDWRTSFAMSLSDNDVGLECDDTERAHCEVEMHICGRFTNRFQFWR